MGHSYRSLLQSRIAAESEPGRDVDFDPWLAAQSQGGGGNAYVAERLRSYHERTEDFERRSAPDAAGALAAPASPPSWRDRVAAAQDPEAKASLLTEALSQSASVPPGLSPQVTLIPRGSVLDSGNDVTDRGHQDRLSNHIYFDPGLESAGLSLAMQRDDATFGGLFGHEWTDDPSVPGYIVLGPAALSASDPIFTATVVYHEWIHQQARLGVATGDYDLDAVEAIKRHATERKNPLGGEVVSAAKEAMAHALDFRQFFGRLAFDPAGNIEQPSLASLVAIADRYWVLLDDHEIWDGVPAVMRAVLDDIAAVPDHKALREMLGIVQPSGGKFATAVRDRL